MFSSPQGDGLIHRNYLCEIHLGNSFRPRVGMGWFPLSITSTKNAERFRPRGGMGWFSIDSMYLMISCRFSSPGGVGLVLAKLLSNSNFESVFVPSGGLVVRC